MVHACMRGVCDRGWTAACSRCRAPQCCLPRPSKRVGSTEQISRFNTRPARTPVNASPPPSRATAHDSENKMGRYSFLVGLLHPQHHAGFGRRTGGCRRRAPVAPSATTPDDSESAHHRRVLDERDSHFGQIRTSKPQVRSTAAKPTRAAGAPGRRGRRRRGLGRAAARRAAASKQAHRHHRPPRRAY